MRQPSTAGPRAERRASARPSVALGSRSCMPFAASLISRTPSLPSSVGSDMLGALPRTIVCFPRSSQAPLSWERAWIRNPSRPLCCACTYFVLLHLVNARPRFMRGMFGGRAQPHLSRSHWRGAARLGSSQELWRDCGHVCESTRFDVRQKR